MDCVKSFARGLSTSLLAGGVLVMYAASGKADERAIPEDNLAYPVLIQASNGSTGSGFYVNDGKYVYLVTAKHVLFDENTQKLPGCGIDIKTQKPVICGFELLSYSKDPAEKSRNLVALNLSILQENGNVKAHPSQDVAVVRLFSVTMPAASPPPPGGDRAGTSTRGSNVAAARRHH
jgi:hypothetical protein